MRFGRLPDHGQRWAGRRFLEVGAGVARPAARHEAWLVAAVVLAWVTALIAAPGAALVVSDIGLPAASILAGIAWLRAGVTWPEEYVRSARLMAASLLCWSFGAVVWGVLELTVEATPFPSLADAGYLASIPLACGALLSLPVPPQPFGRLRAVLDGLVLAGSTLLVGWVLVLSPVRAHSQEPVAELISLIYPLGDLVLVAVALSVLSRGLRHGGSTGVVGRVGTGVMAMAFADASFAYLVSTGSYRSGLLVDAGWMVGLALLYLAARQPPRPMSTAVEPPYRSAAALPYLAVLLAVVAVCVQRVQIGHNDALVFSVLLATLSLLAARQYLSMLTQHAWIRALEQRVQERTAELQDSTARLRTSEARFRSLVQNSSDVIVLLDDQGVLTYVTPSVQRALGYEPDLLLGAPAGTLVRSEQRAAFHRTLQQARHPGCGPVTIELDLLHSGGSYRHFAVSITDLLEDPAVGAVVLNGWDVTVRRQLEQQLTHQAFHDALTGLPNRALLHQKLDDALASRSKGRGVAVLYLDLDGFKAVNDTLGHHVGDELLQAMSERLLSCVRPSDTVARLGGDEFAVLVPDVTGEPEAAALAGRITTLLSQPYRLQGQDVFVASSVGLALTPNDGSPTTATALLGDADLAMYQAKQQRLGGYQRYQPAMRTTISERVTLESELRHALRRDELVLHFQPTLDVATGRWVGAEALVRWQHPTRGLLAPDAFIALAEQSSLIIDLGRWVLDQACRTLSDWQRVRSDPTLPFMAVNVSGRHLRHPDIVQDVAAALLRHDVPPDRLVLEITETVLVEHTAEMLLTLHELKQLGVQIALDDFGTGYSSLSYLHKFPVDVLKVDRSFVHDWNQQAGELITTIIRLGHTLGLHTVAEGVESAEQLRLLRDLGCEHAQGYLLSRPLPAAELIAFTGPSTVLLPERETAGAGRP